MELVGWLVDRGLVRIIHTWAVSSFCYEFATTYVSEMIVYTLCEPL